MHTYSTSEYLEKCCLSHSRHFFKTKRGLAYTIDSSMILTKQWWVNSILFLQIWAVLKIWGENQMFPTKLSIRINVDLHKLLPNPSFAAAMSPE